MKNTNWWVLGFKAWGSIAIAIILCFMLALFFGLDSVWVKLIIQILDIFIFCGMLYRFYWRAGSKDSNKVELKMAKQDIYKGVKAGALTATPYFLLWLILLIVKIGEIGNAFCEALFLLYSFINVPFSPVINSMIFSFGESYNSVSAFNVALTLFTPIVIIGVSSVAYWLGYKQYIVMDHIIYKDLKKKS